MKRVYLKTDFQERIIFSCTQWIKNNISSGRGGLLGIHGAPLSGKSIIINRIFRLNSIPLHSTALLDMTTHAMFYNPCQALLHSFRIPGDIASWPRTVVIPKFLENYLRLSPLRAVLIDDFHLFKQFSAKDKNSFNSFIVRVSSPPYNISFVVAGNLASRELQLYNWGQGKSKTIYFTSPLQTSDQVLYFANGIIQSRNWNNNLVLSEEMAADINKLTKGVLGEITKFLSLMYQEAIKQRALTGVDLVNVSSQRYRPPDV